MKYLAGRTGAGAVIRTLAPLIVAVAAATFIACSGEEVEEALPPDTEQGAVFTEDEARAAAEAMLLELVDLPPGWTEQVVGVSASSQTPGGLFTFSDITADVVSAEAAPPPSCRASASVAASASTSASAVSASLLPTRTPPCTDQCLLLCPAIGAQYSIVCRLRSLVSLSP